jgi:hypothetical protein
MEKMSRCKQAVYSLFVYKWDKLRVCKHFA